MTRRLIMLEVVDSIFILRGWLAHKLAIEAGLRPTFLGTHGGWAADTARLPDFLAYLERRRIAFVVDEPVAEEHRGDGAGGEVLLKTTSSTAVRDDSNRCSPEVPLFELDGGR